MPSARSASSISWLFAAAFVAAGGVTGCFSGDSGRAPDANRIYFPVGLVVGPGDAATPPRRLYVANSDFDLQYNAGTLQAFDLERLSAFVPHYCRKDSDCDGVDGAPTCDLDGKNGMAPSHFCVDPKTGACGALDVQTPADRLIYPGLCSFLNPYAPPPRRSSALHSTGGASLLVQSVQIGAFVTDVAYRDNPLIDGTARGRLFLPVRGDATLHWIDVDDDSAGPRALYCGQGTSGVCDDDHRRGGKTTDNSRGLQLPPEPFGIAIDDKGEAVVITHQSDGEISLFVNHWEAEDGKPVGPKLEFVLPDLPIGALAITSVPEPAIVSRTVEADGRITVFPGLPCLQYQPGFLMTFRDTAQVRLVHYFSDHRNCTNPGPNGDTRADAGPPDYEQTGGSAATPKRPFLEASSIVGIPTNSLGYNSRGIAVDAARRQTCEAACTDTDLKAPEACLRTCAAVALDVYVSNRTPATLILGHTLPNLSATSSDDLPAFWNALPILTGPSRVIVGDVLDKDGKTPVRRIFVVCFDSRLIYVYDPVSQRVETEIHTGRGPHAFTVDTARGLGYVGQFTDSYIGVVDLNRAHTEAYGKFVLTVGEPVGPRASK